MFVIRPTLVLPRSFPWQRFPTSASSSSGSVSGSRRSSTCREEEEEDRRRIGSTPSSAAPPPTDAVVRAVASTPDFYNTRVIYGSRNSWEIVRSYIVFSLCSVDLIVDRQAKVLWWMRRLLGRRLFVQLVKKTIFGQFMSTDDPSVVLDLARTHAKASISPLFAYTAAEFHATSTGGLPVDYAQNESARDVWCRRNFDALLRGITIASRCKEFTSDKPIVTTKVTFLTDYAVLRRLSEAINQQTKLIESAMIDSCQMKDASMQRRALIEYLTKDVLQRSPSGAADLGHLSPHLAPPGQVTCNTQQSHSQSSECPAGAVDYQHPLSGLLTSIRFHVAFNDSLHGSPSPPAPSAAAQMIINDKKSSVIKLSGKDVARIVNVWTLMTELNQRASESDVFINYDAEQTFIQPAIESLVLDSMRLFNRHQPLVLNTYQCYLKRTFDVLRRDLEICDLEGICFGGKVVRGAYMDEERRLARETNQDDPVNESYEATTGVYSRALDHLLSRSSLDSAVDRPAMQPLSSQPPLRRQPLPPQRIIVATHNLDTVNFVIKQLAERKLDARKIGISFAQLLGTRDYISFALGAAGYPAGKLIHYAEPEDGLAYLSRRVQENRSGLPSPALERHLLQLELKRRILRR